jgi:cell division septation protein DedD
VAYHSNRMGSSRRSALLGCIASVLLTAKGRDGQDQDRRLPIPPNPDEDTKLPNGKSQKNEIAKQAHEQALKDANDLVAAAQQLRDELQNSGKYVVSMSSVKKTEEIEKLARRIRGRLKG